MEFFMLFLILVGGPVAYYAWREYNSPASVSPVNMVNSVDYGKNGRECLVCNYKGKMKTWLSNYTAPQFIILLGLLFFIVPGLIFIAIFWGKFKCPSCGTIGKNQSISNSRQEYILNDDKKCPFCAELIKQEAIVCRFCQRDIPVS